MDVLKQLASLRGWGDVLFAETLFLALSSVLAFLFVSRWAGRYRSRLGSFPARQVPLYRFWSFLARWEIWSLIVLFPLFLRPASLVTYVFVTIVLAVVWLIRKLARGSLTVVTPFDPWVIFLFIWSGLSFLLHNYGNTTFPYLFRFWAGFGLMYLIVNWADSRGKVVVLAYGIGLYGWAMAIAAPWIMMRFFIIPSIFKSIPVILNPPISANTYADVIVLSLPFQLFIITDFWRREKWYLYPAWAVTIALWLWSAFILRETYSRLTYFLFVGILLVWIVLTPRRRWLSAIATLLFVVAAAFVVQKLGLLGKIDLLGFKHFGVSNDVKVRSALWNFTLVLVSMTPLFGLGPDGYRLLHIEYGSINSFFVHAHNIYLQTALDYGLPAMIALAFIWLITLWLGWKAWRYYRLSDSCLAGIALAVLLAMIAFLLHGSLDLAGWQQRVTMFLWFFPGLAMVLYRLTLMSQHR